MTTSETGASTARAQLMVDFTQMPPLSIVSLMSIPQKVVKNAQYSHKTKDVAPSVASIDVVLVNKPYIIIKLPSPI